ncbi:MAG: OmpP1/FadL family transporter [Gemmatimonadaceae bacterium]
MKTTMRNALSTVVLALMLTPGALRAQTNGFVLQCLSARTAGIGCVTRAQGDAPTSLFRDPAGLTAFGGPTLEVNVAPFMPSITFDNTANSGPQHGALHAYPMASFAYVGPHLGPRVAWAVGMEPIGGFGSDFQLQNALLSGAQRTALHYQSFFAAAKFGPSVAVEVAPGLSIGGSVSGVYAQIREFRMPFSMSPTVATGMAAIPQLDPAVYGPLFQQFTELTAYGDSRAYEGLTWAADLGLAYRSPTGFAVSASWSPQRAVNLSGGTATMDMTAQFAQMMQAMVMAREQAYGETPGAALAAVTQQLTSAGLTLQAGMKGTYRAATTLTLPMTVGAGIAVPVSRAWKLAAEVEWRKWSSAEAIMPFKLTDGSNANINLMLNASPTDGRFSYPFQLLWKDALSVKLGTSYQLPSGNVLRGGFLYGQNPVPDNTVFVTFPAISTKAVTVGTTWKIMGFPLDVSYVHAFARELTGCSQGHKIGSEYVNSRTTMSEDVFTVGRVWRF